MICWCEAQAAKSHSTGFLTVVSACRPVAKYTPNQRTPVKFEGFFPGGRWKWIGRNFDRMLGAFVDHLGAQSRQTGDPETLTKNPPSS